MLPHVIAESMTTDREISDLFHLFATLRNLQDQDLIEDFVEMGEAGKLQFLQMNEPRYKYSRGKWKKQEGYKIPKSRLKEVTSKVTIWGIEKQQNAESYYKAYHGIK